LEKWQKLIIKCFENQSLNDIRYRVGCVHPVDEGQSWAYVQFRGSEFHTRNARFRQLQEQRRAKAHRRQAKANSLR